MYTKIFTSTPSAILAADIHIRETTPKCRTDDFQKALWRKFSFLINYAMELNVPILMAGDIGHEDEWSNWLLTKFILLAKQQYIIAVPGQHDLPNHSLKLWSNAGIATLKAGMHNFHLLTEPSVWGYVFHPYAGNIYPCPYGEKPKNIPIKSGFRNILLMHKMVIDNRLWGTQTALSYKSYLKKYDSFDLIVSGDNHEPFVGKYKKRLLVNCGSMIRTTTAQIDHRPRFYVWFSKANKVQPIYYPIENDVISDEHIVDEIEEESRIKNYVSHLNTKHEITLSYKENLKTHIKENKTKKPVRNKIWENVK